MRPQTSCKPQLLLVFSHLYSVFGMMFTVSRYSSQRQPSSAPGRCALSYQSATATVMWSKLPSHACHRNRQTRCSCCRICHLQSTALFRLVNWHIVDASLGSVLLFAVPLALPFASALLSTETQNGLTSRPPVSRASSLDSAQLRATGMHMSSEDFEDWPPSVLALTWLVQLLRALRCCLHQLAPAATQHPVCKVGSSSMHGTGSSQT